MEKPAGRSKRLGKVAAAGGELVFGVGAGVLVGRWLDRLLGTTPWLTAGGVLVGFASGMWALYRAATRE